MTARRSSAARGIALAIAVAAVAAAAAVIGPALARAAPPPLITGINDTVYRSTDPGERTRAFNRTGQAGADLVRINVPWRGVLRPAHRGAQPPSGQADPHSPAYDFAALDEAVRQADARGLAVLLTVFRAPRWAEGANRPAAAPEGSWRPRPAPLRRVARALADRYSGRHPLLPRVRHFQAWNEPNLRGYLTPQRRQGQSRSPRIYRRMLRAFYRGVRLGQQGVAPRPLTVGAGTAPFGEPRGPRRIRPLAFWRQVLCLRGRRALRPHKCNRARLDILAHHPINTEGGPARGARHYDDLTAPDLGRLRRVLRVAERNRRILPVGRTRPLWVTEFWWQSNPPNTHFGVPPARHARWTQWGMYEFWRRGARAAVTHLVTDGESSNMLSVFATGLHFSDSVNGGRAKPALRAFRFPLVARRRAPRRLFVWSRSPAAGQARVELRVGGQWRVVARRNVAAGQIFRATVNRPRRANPWRLRARVASEQSLVWRQR